METFGTKQGICHSLSQLLKARNFQFDNIVVTGVIMTTYCATGDDKVVKYNKERTRK